MGLSLNPEQSRVIFSSSHANQALTLKALFSKGGLRQVDWARLFQSSQTSVKAMANKGRLLLKALLRWKGAGRSGVALPWLKTDKLAASHTASHKRSGNVWQRVWKRRASWVR